MVWKLNITVEIKKKQLYENSGENINIHEPGSSASKFWNKYTKSSLPFAKSGKQLHMKNFSGKKKIILRKC